MSESFLQERVACKDVVEHIVVALYTKSIYYAIENMNKILIQHDTSDT